MQDILGSLPAILKELDPSGEAVEPVVFAAWKRCIDGTLAANVVPLRLEKNRLIAAVPNETWRRNVADLGPALAAKVNAAVGSTLVKFIEFQVNAAAVREHRQRSNQDDQQELERTVVVDQFVESLRPAAESIADGQLREQFLHAAASSLARPRESDLSGIADS
jgi:hypothetical protein